VLYPAGAHWVEQGAGSLALLSYDAVRENSDPKATLLGFLESTYDAGVQTAGWDADALRSSSCPTQQQLQQAYFR